MATSSSNDNKYIDACCKCGKSIYGKDYYVMVKSKFNGKKHYCETCYKKIAKGD